MSVLDDFQALPSNELRPGERELIRLRVNDLRKALGAPGDWGYGTKLGELTRILIVQSDAL